ncbi:hypothetical protein BLOT_012981 [Blomia tropicalis]|nr:hypothetical protein BLOT_012981 [Blomia tropicalis]
MIMESELRDIEADTMNAMNSSGLLLTQQQSQNNNNNNKEYTKILNNTPQRRLLHLNCTIKRDSI